MNCIVCNKEIKDDSNLCNYCWHYQNTAEIKIGEKVIYDPDIRTITYIWDPFEIYNFYPGMQMTISNIRRNDEGRIIVNVDEVEGDFRPIEFRVKEKTSLNEQIEITKKFIKIWQGDKFPFLKFRKGQKVYFCPSNLTKSWIRNGILEISLEENKEYVVEKTIERKFLLLNHLNKVYWKDVKITL